MKLKTMELKVIRVPSNGLITITIMKMMRVIKVAWKDPMNWQVVKKIGGWEGDTKRP